MVLKIFENANLIADVGTIIEIDDYLFVKKI